MSTEARLVISARCLEEYRQLDSRLHEIVRLALREWGQLQGLAFCGRIWSSAAEELALGVPTSGIHRAGPPYRAMDLSRPPWAVFGPHWQACYDRTAAVVNAVWVYDPARPDKQCAFSAPHGTGPHLHLQVHQNTTRSTAS